MADKHAPASRNQGIPFDMSSCEEMIKQFMPQGQEGCDCGEMMSQIMSQSEIPDECLRMMSRMRDSFAGEEANKKESLDPETMDKV